MKDRQNNVKVKGFLEKTLLLFVLILVLLGLAVINKWANLQNNKPSLPLVGVLAANDLRMIKNKGLQDGLEALGYRENVDIKFIVKNASSHREELLPLAQELIDSEIDVLVTTGRVETEVAKKIKGDNNIPVVFMGLTAIKHDDLVKNVLHPLEGLTGIQNDHAELSGKRLELLKKILPQLKKVLVLYDPNVIPAEESLVSTQKAALSLGIAIQIEPVNSIDQIKKVFSKDLTDISAVLLLPSFFLESEGAQIIIPLAKEKGLPVMGVEHDRTLEYFAVYGITPYNQGRQAARIVAKILDGQDPADIPVEPPADLQLTINMKVIEQLQLEIEPNFLNYAEIIYPDRNGKKDG